MRTIIWGAVAVALAGAVAPALAKGPGVYEVQGFYAEDKSSYKGTVTITKTGPDTWQVVSLVDDEKFDGYAIGDEDLLAVAYSDGEESAIALYVSQADGSYKGVWAAKGDTKVSVETLTPK